MIPDDVVDRVRDEADIVQIIGEFVKLKRVGNSYRGPCPFHQGTHDNFSVLPRGSYMCFVCGEKGNVFTFIQKRLGLDFVSAVKLVGEKAGIEVREVTRQREGPDPREPLWEVNAATAEFFREQLWKENTGATAREYLAGRGITREDAERFALGYAPRDTALLRSHLSGLGFDDARQLAAGVTMQREELPEPRSRFRNRLMFPIHDLREHVVGFGGRVLGEGEPKYLNSAESEIFAKRRLLYNLDSAKQAIRRVDRLLLVEGYFDVIRLVLAGIDEVVAPLGTALTEAQAALIRKYTKNVFLLYDSDEPGLKATFRSGDELLRNGVSVRVVTLPDGEDPDTFVAKEGAAGLERAITQSIDVFDRKVQLLERRGWFSDLRRKRQALDKMLPTIRATSDRLMRDLYVARTSEVAGVSREMLEEELSLAPSERDESSGGQRSTGATRMDGEASSDSQPGRRATPRRERHAATSGRVRAERELVRVLLHERRYLEAIGERIGPEQFSDPMYRRIYSELIELGPDATIGEIAGSFDEETLGGELEELIEERGGLDRAAEIVEGSVSAILSRDLDARLVEIDRELRLASGDEQDVLIREKQRLMREMQALGRQRYKSFRAPTS